MDRKMNWSEIYSHCSHEVHFLPEAKREISEGFIAEWECSLCISFNDSTESFESTLWVPCTIHELYTLLLLDTDNKCLTITNNDWLYTGDLSELDGISNFVERAIKIMDKETGNMMKNVDWYRSRYNYIAVLLSIIGRDQTLSTYLS